MASITYSGDFGGKYWHTSGGFSATCTSSVPSGIKTIQAINVEVTSQWSSYSSSSTRISADLSISGSFSSYGSISGVYVSSTPFTAYTSMSSGQKVTLPTSLSITLSNGVVADGRSGTARGVKIIITYQDEVPTNYNIVPPYDTSVYIGPTSSPTTTYYESSSASSFYLKWNAATTQTGSVRYVIYRNGATFTTTTSTSHQVSTSGLSQGNSYQYTIRAENVSNSSYYYNYSGTATFNYLQPQATLGPPTNVRVNNSSSNLIVASGTSLTISWGAGTSATGYRYSYRVNGVETQGTTTGTSYSFQFTGSPGVLVTEVRVQSYNATLTSSWISWGYNVKINTPPSLNAILNFTSVSAYGKTVTGMNNIYTVKSGSSPSLTIGLPGGSDVDSQSLSYSWSLYNRASGTPVATGSGLTVSYNGTLVAGDEYFVTMRVYDGLTYTPSIGQTELVSRLVIGVEVTGVSATILCDTILSTVFYKTVKITSISSNNIKPNAFNYYYSINGGTTFTLMGSIIPTSYIYEYTVPESILNNIVNGKNIVWRVEVVGMNTIAQNYAGYSKVRWPSINSYALGASSVPSDPNYGIVGASGAALVGNATSPNINAYKNLTSSFNLKWEEADLTNNLTATTDFGADYFSAGIFLTYGEKDYIANDFVISYGTSQYSNIKSSIYYLDWDFNQASSKYNNTIIHNVGMKMRLTIMWGPGGKDYYDIFSNASIFSLNFQAKPEFGVGDFSSKSEVITKFIQPSDEILINYPRAYDTNRVLSRDQNVVFSFFLESESGYIIDLGTVTHDYGTIADTTHSTRFTVPNFPSNLRKQTAKLYIKIIDDINTNLNTTSSEINITNSATSPINIEILGFVGLPIIDNISYSRDNNYIYFNFTISDIGGNSMLDDSSAEFNTFNNIIEGTLLVNYNKDSIFGPDHSITKPMTQLTWASGFIQSDIIISRISSNIISNEGGGRYTLQISIDEAELSRDDALYAHIGFSNGIETAYTRIFYIEGTDPQLTLHKDGISIRTSRKNTNVTMSIRDQGSHIIDFYNADNTNSIIGYIRGVDDEIEINGTTSTISMNLLSENWNTISGQSYKGYYDIINDKITGTSTQEIFPRENIMLAELDALDNARIVFGTQSSGITRIYAFGTIPQIDIPILLRIRRC